MQKMLVVCTQSKKHMIYREKQKMVFLHLMLKEIHLHI